MPNQPRHHRDRTGVPTSTRKKASPATARGTRTALQGGAGLLLAEFVDTVIYDMPPAGVVILAAILGGLVSWLQVTIEDAIGHAFLREIPEPDQPVADATKPEAGMSTGEVALLVIAVVLLLILLSGLGLFRG